MPHTNGQPTRTDLAALLVDATTEAMGSCFAAWVFADGSPFWTLLPPDGPAKRSVAAMMAVAAVAERLIDAMPPDVCAATLAHVRRRRGEEGGDDSHR